MGGGSVPQQEVYVPLSAESQKIMEILFFQVRDSLLSINMFRSNLLDRETEIHALCLAVHFYLGYVG